MKLEYHLSTIADLNEAVIYYNDLQLGLGNRFRSEIYEAIERIKTNPLIYPEINGVRRALLNRFPYSIVYRLVEDQTIRVLLIRHHSLHPEHESRRE